MKKIMILAAALFLVAATSGAAMAFTWADQVVNMTPTPDGIANNHAPSMNMNWLNDPGTLYQTPNPNPDRVLGAYDQYAVGWGPKGAPWEGSGNVIVKMGTSFTHDGVVATGGPVNYDVTDEAVLSGMGYDLVVYGLGYGFDEPFGSHGQVKVYVSETASSNIADWTLVSSWSGEPNGYILNPSPEDIITYYENQDGTLYDGTAFNNGGFSAWSHTYLTIDMDNLKIIDPETGQLATLDPATGVYNYIWLQTGYEEEDWYTHGNATFLDAFGANPVPIPGAVWLLGSGLLGLMGIRRRKG
ncbi:MAG: hypothetical protein PVG39_10400 [Desulfobacteraceae bacterium]|jgi:hypothetical protein